MYFHDGREYIDDTKESFFITNNYNLLVILAQYDYSNTVNGRYLFFDGKDFTWLISTIYTMLNIQPLPTNTDIQRFYNESLKNRNSNKVINCIAETNPEILEIWDFEKNGDSGLTPYNLTRGTKYKAWFWCPKCGNSYYSQIRKQVAGQRCPTCYGSTSVTSENSLAATHPEILPIWDFEKNSENGITPDTIRPGSSKTVFIKCRNCGDSEDYQMRDIVKRENTIKCRQCKARYFQ